MNKNKNNVSKIICTVLCLLVAFSACKKLSPDDLIMSKLKIPGLGNDERSIEGNPFIFPQGVSIEGEIRGYDGTKKSDTILGSGSYVEVLLPLKNTNSTATLVELPAALIFQCYSLEYQNGLLIKKIKFLVPANRTYYVLIKLYCANMARHASSGSALYHNPIVCGTKEVVQFCDLFKNKAVNIEDKQANYASNVSKIQSIVWDFTQRGVMPSGEKLDFINSLPNN